MANCNGLLFDQIRHRWDVRLPVGWLYVEFSILSYFNDLVSGFYNLYRYKKRRSFEKKENYRWPCNRIGCNNDNQLYGIPPYVNRSAGCGNVGINGV